jgi:hypothetical protein
MNVGVEAHDRSRGIDRKDCRRNLSRIHQIESVAAEIHGSSQLAEQSTLWLPGDAIGKSPLDLKTLLPLHPRIDGGQNIPRIARNRSRRRRVSGAGYLCDEPPFFGDIDSRSLFRQRLIDGARAQPDFVSYVEKLTLADQITGLWKRARALELRRSSKNALERLSVEQRLS